MQGKSQKADIPNTSEAPVVSDLLKVLRQVREFNCTHAPVLMSLPHFQNMDAAVFGVLKEHSVAESSS